MQRRNNSSKSRHEHPLPDEISNKEKERAIMAHKKAEKDMKNDPDLSVGSPNDDLDEGETARLGEDKTGLV